MSTIFRKRQTDMKNIEFNQTGNNDQKLFIPSI